MKRTIVIGDIHGGLRALHQLMAKINPTENDKLIFLGDYVDGWSESAQVISYLIDLETKYECIFIKGNHDIWCEEWLKNKLENSTWLTQGGKYTVTSYLTLQNDTINNHILFFERMRNFYIDGENNLYIHAGFSSMHGPEKEHYSSNFSWDRTLWETAVSMDKHLKKHSELYPKRLLLFKEIFIGHTPTLTLNVDVPLNKANIWNIDTGAAFHGKLSAINIDTKEFWQSDKVMDLYPDEKGRN